MKFRAMFLTVAAVSLLGTGCLSFQKYGSPMRGYTISEGARRADVLANLGEPDSIYRNDDVEAFFYKGFDGANYFGIVSIIERMDTVVVMNSQGTVLSAQPIDMGKGVSILSGIIFDSTHPVRTTTLTGGPDNYSYEASN